MKIYTYYNNIGFNNQNELLDLWKTSWSKQKFEPIVLTPNDVAQHLMFNEFKTNIVELHKQIMNKPISEYGLACWLRWLAYATVPNEKFYVSDYDVMNHNFSLVEPDDQLHFLNGYCPCMASGTSNQFEQMCKQTLSFIDQHLQNIIEIVQIKQFKHFHDQEFLLITHFLNLELFKTSDDRNVRFGFPGEGNFWEKQLVHYSSASCSFYCTTNKLPFNSKSRCEIIKKYLTHTV